MENFQLNDDAWERWVPKDLQMIIIAQHTTSHFVFSASQALEKLHELFVSFFRRRTCDGEIWNFNEFLLAESFPLWCVLASSSSTRSSRLRRHSTCWFMLTSNEAWKIYIRNHQSIESKSFVWIFIVYGIFFYFIEFPPINSPSSSTIEWIRRKLYFGSLNVTRNILFTRKDRRSLRAAIDSRFRFSGDLHHVHPHNLRARHWHGGSEIYSTISSALNILPRLTYVEQALLAFSPWESLVSDVQVLVFLELWTMHGHLLMLQVGVQHAQTDGGDSDEEWQSFPQLPAAG